MGWLFKSKEQKAAEAKQKAIEENNRRINEKLSDEPYLGSKQKEINSNKMRIANEQESNRADVSEKLTSLMRLVNQTFEDEDSTEEIRELVNLSRKLDLGLNAGTTQTVKSFIIKQIGLANSACLAKNQAAVDGISSGLYSLLLDMGDETKKKYYENEEYVNNRLDLFAQQARMKELATKERLAKEHIKKLGLKLQKNKDYMTAAEWRNEQVNYANTLKQIENARIEAQRRLQLAQSHINEIETNISSQSVISDDQRLRSHENIMRAKEQREDVSSDLDNALDELNQNNAHVSNANMGMTDLGVSNQKVDDAELADFLNTL